MFEAKVEKVKRPAATRNQTRDTSDLSCQCSATELQQPDTLTFLYMYCTDGTKMPQSHTWQPLGMCRQNSIRG